MGAIASQITSLTIVYSTVHSQIKGNIKAPRHWPLCGEFTGDRWIPHTNGQRRGKCFHLMTSSCGSIYASVNWLIIASVKGSPPVRRRAILPEPMLTYRSLDHQETNAFENVICQIASVLSKSQCVNSSPRCDAYMRQWIGSALVQIMAYSLFGAKPLSKPILGYCQLDP